MGEAQAAGVKDGSNDDAKAEGRDSARENGSGEPKDGAQKSKKQRDDSSDGVKECPEGPLVVAHLACSHERLRPELGLDLAALPFVVAARKGHCFSPNLVS